MLTMLEGREKHEEQSKNPTFQYLPINFSGYSNVLLCWKCWTILLRMAVIFLNCIVMGVQADLRPQLRGASFSKLCSNDSSVVWCQMVSCLNAKPLSLNSMNIDWQCLEWRLKISAHARFVWCVWPGRLSEIGLLDLFRELFPGWEPQWLVEV